MKAHQCHNQQNTVLGTALQGLPAADAHWPDEDVALGLSGEMMCKVEGAEGSIGFVHLFEQVT